MIVSPVNTLSLARENYKSYGQKKNNVCRTNEIKNTRQLSDIQVYPYCINQKNKKFEEKYLSVLYDIAILNANLDIENAKENGISETELQNMIFAKKVLEIAKFGVDSIKRENDKKQVEPSFSSKKINNPEERMKNNKLIIHGCATVAACSAAALAQTPAGDEAVLTALTTGMVARLCLNYEDASLAIFTPIAAQVFGKVIGEATAKIILSWIPYVGNAANAAITFALHETTGWAMVAALEQQEKDGTICKDVDELIDKGREYMKSSN